MARSPWQWMKSLCNAFFGDVSRQLTDVWTTPAAMGPRLEELGVQQPSGSDGRHRAGSKR